MSRASDITGRKLTMTHLTRRLILLVAVAAGVLMAPLSVASGLPPGAPKVGMVCTPPNGSGATTYDLWTGTGFMQTPDGNSVFMWGYQEAPGDANFQTPGPVLCVNEGQTVSVTLHNTLAEASSIIFPGQDASVTATGGSAGLLTREAASGGTVTYTFVAANPGTYLYESGTNVSKQIEMGLYGALIVRPAGAPDRAYGPARTAFDPSREYLLLLAEIDPDLHHAVETGSPIYDFTQLHNRYYMINGRSFPDTVQDNNSVLLPGQPYGSLVRIQPNTATDNRPALIRMINAGVENHPFHPHGNHTREIAQDGQLLQTSSGGAATTEHFGETIASGQTIDYLIRWDNHETNTAGVSFNDDWSPANPLPVAQPNYRNLTFKDSVTWYAASPYLGYKGTLPTGTSSLNLCGEWYFPLHSHALNEFANFDAPFGGMGTLLRVDPAGGCFAFPGATKVLAGAVSSGLYTALAADDSNLYNLRSTTTGTRTTDWYGQFKGIATGSANLKVTYKGNNTLSATQRLYLWNWTTSTWFPIAGPTTVGTTDVTVTPAPVASPANYIGKGSNRGLVRVRVLTTRATNFTTRANFMKLVYDAP
jgi:FtsP/CotA-like multicopper oxidase with cupredoxin domain